MSSLGIPAARDQLDRWFVAGSLALAGFMVLEGSTRKPGAASSLEAEPDDRGTTGSIAASYVVAGALVPLVRRLPGVRLPRVTAAVGLGLEAVGLAVRAWSMRTLRDSYSRTLRVTEDQPLVDTGPYAFVRHPGYLGSIATWTGFALTSRRALGLVGVVALLGRAYRRRIEAEEALLASRLPGYEAYMKRTWRLIPGFW